MNKRTSHAISLIYDDAYDLIDGYGWARGAEATATGLYGYCLGVAMVTAALRGNRQRYLRPAIDVLEATTGVSMVEFNDSWRGSRPVLRLLERLADVYRRLG